MKSNLKSFLKFGLVTQLPVYGFFLWCFLSYGISYFYAWVLTNIVYWILMYPIYKKGIFNINFE